MSLPGIFPTIRKQQTGNCIERTHSSARPEQTDPDPLPATQPSVQPWPTSGAWSWAKAMTISSSDSKEKRQWAEARERERNGWKDGALFYAFQSLRLLRMRPSGDSGEVNFAQCRANLGPTSLYLCLFPFFSKKLFCLFSLQLALTSNFIPSFLYWLHLVKQKSPWSGSGVAEVKAALDENREGLSWGSQANWAQ